jgi:hypothetical protein
MMTVLVIQNARVVSVSLSILVIEKMNAQLILTVFRVIVRMTENALETMIVGGMRYALITSVNGTDARNILIAMVITDVLVVNA